MKIKVTQCCHSSQKPHCFEAGVGDSVLIRSTRGIHLEATIQSVISSDSVVVSMVNSEDKSESIVAVSDITAVMVGD